MCPKNTAKLRLDIFKALFFPDLLTGKTGNITGNAIGNFSGLLLLTAFFYGDFLNVLTLFWIVFFEFLPSHPELVRHMIPASFPAL